MLLLLCPTVTAHAETDRRSVILGGTPFGLTMYTGGELDLDGFAMPTDLRSANQAGQADDQALADAFQPVMDYVATHAVSDGE